MQLDHRCGDDELQHHDTECRPGGVANGARFCTLANTKDDTGEVSEQQEGDYPMRYLNHERSAVLRDDSTQRKSLAGCRCARSVRSERAKYEYDKRDCSGR